MARCVSLRASSLCATLILSFQTHDILIGPETPSDHLVQKYTNTIIGRYANRVPAGAHTFTRKGLTGTLNAASNESPTVSLHGGITGWDLQPWDPLPDLSAAQLFTPAEISRLQADAPTSVIFRRESPDGEEGYPGRLLIEVLVRLAQPQGKPSEDGKLWKLGSVLLLYRAKLLEEGKVTPINVTQVRPFPRLHRASRVHTSLASASARTSVP